ncbi:transcriptional regulator with XRE-family HTH domain [Dokdonella fugitiva]|uniref:Transcriptional regulator with XRE-family HTH domain n=1 Tax=Dokdonella fugitiva TaxID=328517 RepID=A0A839F2A6_9GAMM|nr:helix-turn-helix transcriptional regulator [Dokdonella fugitiva]MBA8888716.1 transcriptional regulator with XRE-family HTH domain [Dokdonella fugitiva]
MKDRDIREHAFTGPRPNRIRHARRLARLTQAKLAEAIGVGASAVAQWELPSGTSPTAEHLERIATVCSVSFEWLATGRGAAVQGVAETPAIDVGELAADEFEDRLLVAFRRVPRRKREAFVRWMEEFF